MRKQFVILGLLSTIMVRSQIVSFDIIEPSKKPSLSNINTAAIKNFSEPVQAIVAYYAALAGSNCNGITCELTDALGLGNQGSEAHKALLQKYFKGDKTAEALITKGCYLPSTTDPVYSNYEYLRFLVEGNKVIIQYKVMQKNKEVIRYIESDNDEIWIEPNGLKVKKKKLLQTLK
jgi:hypothetical protein